MSCWLVARHYSPVPVICHISFTMWISFPFRYHISKISTPLPTTLRFLRTFHTSHKALNSRNIKFVDSCPEPTCSCAVMPVGLDIDYKRPLLNSMARYDEHILLSTGKSDWASRIEQDETIPLAKEIKEKIRPGGKFFDVGSIPTR